MTRKTYLKSMYNEKKMKEILDKTEKEMEEKIEKEEKESIKSKIMYNIIFTEKDFEKLDKNLLKNAEIRKELWSKNCREEIL